MDGVGLCPCVSLWIGDQMTVLERACLRSVMAQGHAVTLYVYEDVSGIPEGVQVADANLILPKDRIIRHKSGSVALFSDHFRYELMRLGKGIWVDTDVYLFKPINQRADEHLFGWEWPGIIGSNILWMPPDSPILEPVLRLFDQPYLPDWLRLRDQLPARWRAWREGRVDLGQLPWGVAGPQALTALAKRYGLAGQARPKAVFSPFSYHDVVWIFDPHCDYTTYMSDETRGFHLYNYIISHQKERPAAPGSFMHRLQAEGA